MVRKKDLAQHYANIASAKGRDNTKLLEAVQIALGTLQDIPCTCSGSKLDMKVCQPCNSIWKMRRLIETLEAT